MATSRRNSQTEDEIRRSEFFDDFDEDFDPKPTRVRNIAKNRRLWRLLCTPLVTILVGPTERRFHLHRGLLRRHSLFFRRMLVNDRFQEGKTQVVKLPEDDVGSFAVFAEWLYLGCECDTSAIFRDGHGKDINENDDDFLGVLQPDVFGAATNGSGEEIKSKSQNNKTIRKEAAVTEEPQVTSGEENGGAGAAEEDEEVWETGSVVESIAEYDHYDFTLQFSCYVLADKLQAIEFKEHILDEIRYYGEFCEPSNLTADHIRYVYQNTTRKDDPLRKFCLMLKCIIIPIDETLGDPEFLKLMEAGGPLVNDVMKICRKYAAKESWGNSAQEDVR